LKNYHKLFFLFTLFQISGSVCTHTVMVILQLPQVACVYGSSAAVHIHDVTISILNSSRANQTHSFSPAFTWGHKISQANGSAAAYGKQGLP